MEISWVDWTIVAIIGISTLISVFRGFTREIFSLLTWLIAILVAVHFTPSLSVWLAAHIGPNELRLITAFSALFVATIILGSLINYAIGQLINGSGLSGTDRLLGSVFGVIRGVFISVLLIIAAGLTPLVNQVVWKEAHLVPALKPFTDWMLTLIPQEAAMAWLKELKPESAVDGKKSQIAAPPKALLNIKNQSSQASSNNKTQTPATSAPQNTAPAAGTSSHPEQSAPATEPEQKQSIPSFSYPGNIQH